MYKIGDELLCKKDDELESRLSYLSKAEFKKDQVYIIEKIYDPIVIVRGNNNTGPEIYFYSNENSGDKYNRDFFYYSLSEYFYTNKEIRKIKLNKINEQRYL